MERIKFLNTYVDNLSMQETVEEVEKFILKKKPLHLIGVNADKVNVLKKNPRLRQIVNDCDIINADGISIVWASKKLGKPLKERVAGIDLMMELLKLAEDKGYKVYFLGAKQQVIEKTIDVVEQRYPKLKIVGFRNGYFSENEWPEIADKLKKSEAQIVLVGITSPLKEYLIEYLQKQELDSIFMGVGGSFDVISGNINRAPQWVQNIGMEWMFRFLQEPGRLWKRYILGNAQFIWSVYREKYKRKGE